MRTAGSGSASRSCAGSRSCTAAASAATSAGPGRGSELVVRLPAIAPPAAAVADVPRAARRSAREILLVEDNEDVRETLRDLLEHDGHRVRVACDGAEGLEAALAAPPDVALIDIGLPELDGYELARRFRAAHGGRSHRARRAHRLRHARGPRACARGRLRRAPREAGRSGGTGADPRGARRGASVRVVFPAHADAQGPRGPPMIELAVPGRLCLFGEHSDWAGRYRTADPSLRPGFCLVAGTDQELRAEARRAGGFEIESLLPDGRRAGPLRLPWSQDALGDAARAGGFFAYAAGAAAELCARGVLGGAALRVRSDLPVRKGLSSSAATCVLVARAFDRLYGLGLGERGEIEVAFAGERRTGSECGRMDQICAYGRRATFLRFDGESLDVEVLAPAGALHLLVVDLRREKDTRRILRDLNGCFPAAPGARAAAVREALGPRNEALLARARAAVVGGDARALGALMREAQALFDAQVAPACPELRAPRLHEVLAHPAVAELALGGKGVGSGGDGSAQLVAPDPAARDALAKRLETELGVACLPLTIAPA